jgi:uncharacterized membrane protein YphA (DoxX/SURF4 family)
MNGAMQGLPDGTAQVSLNIEASSPTTGWRAFLLPVVRLIIGFLLIASAGGKLMNPYAFLQTIHSFELLPHSLAVAVAVMLPSLEIVLGACLMAGLAVSAAFVLSSLLLLVFTAVLASVVWRGLSVPCGCFGTTSWSPTTWGTVGRTFAWSALAIFGSLFALRASAHA